jgi:hypothetical protein
MPRVPHVADTCTGHYREVSHPSLIVSGRRRYPHAEAFTRPGVIDAPLKTN